MLPPDMLIRIFREAAFPRERLQQSQRNGSIAFHFDTISGVSTYWRQLTIATPSYWSHIQLDIGLWRASEFCAQLWLKRAQTVPLHLYILKTSHALEQTAYSPYDLSTLVARIARITSPHAQHITSLKLSLNNEIAQDVLNLMIKQCCANPGVLQSLEIWSCASLESTSLGVLDNVVGVANLHRSLRYLTIIQSPVVWNCPYRNLVDLRILSPPKPATTAEVQAVLSANPQLRTLALRSMKISHHSKSLALAPASLPFLEVLDLSGTVRLVLQTSFPSSIRETPFHYISAPGQCTIVVVQSMSSSHFWIVPE
jgi:hypothetical protein